MTGDEYAHGETGEMWAHGLCVVCKDLFAFDPELVPSYGGEPICEDCIKTINAEKAKRGLELVTVYPGTYPNQGGSGQLKIDEL